MSGDLLAVDHCWAVLNPSTRRADRALDLLRAAGIPDERILRTTPEEPGERAARQAIDHGARRVIAVGGDGTVRRVAGSVAGSDAVLGILPAGTANLAALNLGISRHSLRLALRRALGDRLRRVDVGWVVRDRGVPEPFLVVAGIGNDAQTLADMSPHRKSALGWLAYYVEGIRSLPRPPSPMSVNGGAERDLWCVLGVNAGRIGELISMAPGSRPSDGRLRLMEVTAHGYAQWVPIAAGGLLHYGRDLPGIARRSVSQFTVTTREPTLVELDGDVVGHATELTCRLEPAVLTVA